MSFPSHRGNDGSFIIEMFLNRFEIVQKCYWNNKCHQLFSTDT